MGGVAPEALDMDGEAGRVRGLHQDGAARPEHAAHLDEERTEGMGGEVLDHVGDEHPAERLGGEAIEMTEEVLVPGVEAEVATRRDGVLAGVDPVGPESRRLHDLEELATPAAEVGDRLASAEDLRVA